jgi:polysaccharide pyruvyl transferase WcaK-like protein
MSPELERGNLKFAVGAWGVGNVGDDAIAFGMRAVFGETIRLIGGSTTPGVAPTLYIADALACCMPGDVWVFGGGGTVTDDDILRKHFLPLAREAKKRGCSVRISRMGFEQAEAVDHDLLKELFGHCYHITVRSPWSVEFVQGLGYAAELLPDFALSVPGPGERSKEYDVLTVNFGRVGTEELEQTATIVEGYVKRDEPLLLLSHCGKHLLNAALGEATRLKKLAKLYPADLITWAAPETVAEALEYYAAAHKVITARLHGAYLANVCGVPWEPVANCKKKLATVYIQ